MKLFTQIFILFFLFACLSMYRTCNHVHNGVRDFTSSAHSPSRGGHPPRKPETATETDWEQVATKEEVKRLRNQVYQLNGKIEVMENERKELVQLAENKQSQIVNLSNELYEERTAKEELAKANTALEEQNLALVQLNSRQEDEIATLMDLIDVLQPKADRSDSNARQALIFKIVSILLAGALLILLKRNGYFSRRASDREAASTPSSTVKGSRASTPQGMR